MSFDILKLFSLPSKVELFEFPGLPSTFIQLYVKRDDLIHPEVQGNKWRKLQYNFQQASLNNQQTIITMGGPWSNHLAATASACRLLGFNSEAYIRGKQKEESYSYTLQHCVKKGMRLHFLEKSEYDELKKSGLTDLPATSFFIPEGGANALGVKGCVEILKEDKNEYDYVCVPVGSGTTCAGLLLSARGHTCILAFSVFKNSNEIKNLVADKIRLYENDETRITEALSRLHIIDRYHFGGFAKVNHELLTFRLSLYNDTGLDTDLVYTAKMFYGIKSLITSEYFRKGQKIMILHTGGVQGNQGFQPDINQKVKI